MLNLYSAFPPWGAQSALQIFPRRAIAFQKSFSTSWEAYRCSCGVALKHLHSNKIVHCPCAGYPFYTWVGWEKMVVKCLFQGHTKQLRPAGESNPGPLGYETITLLTELFRHRQIAHQANVTTPYLDHIEPELWMLLFAPFLLRSVPNLAPVFFNLFWFKK